MATPVTQSGAPSRYRLKGSTMFPQVEPGAAFWLRGAVPRALTLEEIRRDLDHRIPEFDESGSAAANADLAKVRNLATQSADPAFFRNTEQLSAFLSDSRYIFRPLPTGSTRPSPTPVYPPPGAVYNRRSPIDRPFLRNGVELARLFENETPGLWHRHVLNILLDPTVEGGLGQRLSPPRQALIWAALDVAISSALQAAWYYKWFSLDDRRFSFRERPKEADPSLPVLYDYMIAYDAAGNIIAGPMRPAPLPTPGTPRHPAYPSGHSTYSAAASTVLGCLLPGYRASFARLANNIGRARLWAGVHWVQDHTTGQLIGRTVGELIIAQLNRSGIDVMPARMVEVPTMADLRQMEDDFYRRQREGVNFCPRAEDASVEETAGGMTGEHWVMNPGSYFESADAKSTMPPADADGELDIDMLEAEGGQSAS